jgi:hypothetical protein
VYAVEASEMSQVCEAIVKDSGYADRITVFHGKVEDFSLPAGVKADIIVSEWMGFYLLHESMFDSIIVAREKFLAPGGVMVPSEACLYACPITMIDYYKDKFDSWKSYHGFNFSVFGQLLKAKALQQPIIHEISPNQFVSNPELVFHMDMHFVDRGDFDSISRVLKFEATKHCVFHGVCFWFDVQFPGSGDIKLDTSPGQELTHWKQTTVCLPDPLLVRRGDELNFTVQLHRDPENKRRYTIDLLFMDSEEEEESEDHAEDFDEGDVIEMEDDEHEEKLTAVDLLRDVMEHSSAQ